MGRSIMTQLQAERLIDILLLHPKHAPYMTLERIAQLERMRNFYVDKAAIAPEKQAHMFIGFASALDYAVNTIQQYDQLVSGLKDIVKDK